MAPLQRTPVNEGLCWKERVCAFVKKMVSGQEEHHRANVSTIM